MRSFYSRSRVFRQRPWGLQLYLRKDAGLSVRFLVKGSHGLDLLGKNYGISHGLDWFDFLGENYGILQSVSGWISALRPQKVQAQGV